MISQVLAENKKYYPCSSESGSFNIETDGISISGSFAETYLVGQYINIYGSILNDGVYKITAVTSSKISVAADTLQAENTDKTIVLYGLALPKALLDLVTKIEDYVVKQTTGANVASESQGNRSVSYKGGSAWQDAFYGQLTPFRSMYDDRFSGCRGSYDINTKRCY